MSTKKSAKKQSLSARLKAAGLHPSTYYARIEKGLSPEQALKTKKRAANTFTDPKTKIKDTAAGWAKRIGINTHSFYNRIVAYGAKSAKLFAPKGKGGPKPAAKKSVKVPAKKIGVKAAAKKAAR